MNPKYLDPGNPMVDVHINKALIQNTLRDLGATINAMTMDTMINLICNPHSGRKP